MELRKIEKSYREFYRDGISEIDFKNTKSLDSILKNLMLSGVNKKEYSLESKYPKTTDLRPDVINYSDIFMDILALNNIKEKIKLITLRDVSLFHVQVRVVQDDRSYMNWHTIYA